MFRQGTGRISRRGASLSGRTPSPHTRQSRQASPIGARALRFPWSCEVVLLKELMSRKKLRRTSDDYLRYLSRYMVKTVTFLEESETHHKSTITSAFNDTLQGTSWKMLRPAGSILVEFTDEINGRAMRTLAGNG